MMRRARPVSFAGLLGLLLFLGLTPATHAAPEQVGTVTLGDRAVAETVGDIMREEASHPSLRSLTDQEQELTQPDRSHLPQAPGALDVSSLPALPPGAKLPQGESSPFSVQTVGINWTAATLAGVNPTLSFPPDCMGAVGPSQFVVFVNGRLVTFNKTTGVADGVLNADPDVFFASVVNGSSTSDPRIRYDRLSGRWFLVIINVSTPNRILIAVSDAASAGVITPSTVFSFFFLNIATTPPTIASTCLADYPTLGVDANALYIGTNNFCGSPSQTFNSTDGWVVRKSSVLSGGPIAVTVFRGLAPTANSSGPYTPQGVDNYDPTSNEGYFIGVDNISFGLLQMRRVSNPGGTPSISANIAIAVPATTSPVLVPHLGNTGGNNGRLASLDDRLFAAHIRNGRLWTAHNIGVNNTGGTATATRCGSRWYELNVPVGSGTPTIVQSGTVFTASGSNTTDQRNIWIPSVMVSGQGHAAMGVSTAGTSEHANSAVTGRLVGDTPGAMPGPTLYTASATAYNPPSDPGSTAGRRWGDYSYTSVDPLDDMTMWTVQMFCDATNSYGVRVAKLIPPPPATPSALADVNAGQSNVSVTLTGTASAGSGFFDPGANLPGVPAYHHLAAAITAGSATGTPPSVVSATYVNPTTINLVLDASAATANLAGEKYTLTVTNPDGQVAAAAVVHVVSTNPVANLGAGPTFPEGNGGSVAFQFPVTLSAAATSAVSIQYTTHDGSATTADNDYAATGGTLNIAIGQTGGTIVVPVNGDTKFEGDETFTVQLTGATNATLGATTLATGTIQNDDPLPTMAVANVTGAEGNAGTTSFHFAVTLSNPSANPVSASFTTADSTATVADNDYVAGTGGVSIPPGATTGDIAVTVNGDLTFETDEVFHVALSAPVGGTLAAPFARGTIQNDDPLPTVSIAGTAAPEGNAGTSVFTFNVSLTNPSAVTVTVPFQTTDGTATVADNDYVPQAGMVTFPPGSVLQPVAVPVNGDLVVEPDETFQVELGAPTGAALGSAIGVGVIQNDDAEPTLSVADVAQLEGNTGATPFVFTATLSAASANPVQVDWHTVDGSATSGSGDYAAASGTLVIPANTLAAPLPITVFGDSCGEANETFTVQFTNAVNAALGTPVATGLIQNDDDAVAPTALVTYPNGGQSFVVGSPVDLHWTASDDVGVTAVDLFVSRDGGLTFPDSIAVGVPNTGTFTWTPAEPASAGGQAFLRVLAHDSGCNAAADTSDAGFTILDEAVAVEGGAAVHEYALGAPRPNPTMGSCTVQFQLPKAGAARIVVVDLRGREVATLLHRDLVPGRYQVAWNGSTATNRAPAGVYFVRFEAGGKRFVRRLVLVR